MMELFERPAGPGPAGTAARVRVVGRGGQRVAVEVAPLPRGMGDTLGAALRHPCAAAPADRGPRHAEQAPAARVA
jgi:hypothetical protein